MFNKIREKLHKVKRFILKKKSVIVAGLISTLFIITSFSGCFEPNINDDFIFPGDNGDSLTLKWISSSTGGATNIQPLAVDINDDGIYEIFVSAQNIITCINGSSGNRIWNHTCGSYYHNPFELYDLDNDGIEDLVIENESNTIALHANNGTEFWNNSEFLGHRHPVIARPDLSTYPFVYIPHGGTPGTLAKVYGNNGTTQKEIEIWYPCWGGLSVADLEGDGDLELILNDRSTHYPDESSNGKGIQCYDADTLELLWCNEDVLCSSHCSALVDVDDDGVLDVVACNQGDDNTSGICCISGVTGKLINGKYDLDLGLSAHGQFSIGDIDQDGTLELVTCHRSNAKVWDIGTWSLDATLDYSVSSPQLANIMGDEKLEIINSESGNIYNSTYDLVKSLGSSHNFKASLVQDVDGDGYMELLLICWGNGSVYAYDTEVVAPSQLPRTNSLYYGGRNTNVPEFYEEDVYKPYIGEDLLVEKWHVSNLGGGHYHLTMGDVDGDGDMEIVAAANSLLIIDGKTGYLEYSNGDCVTGVCELVDIDGDNILDIVYPTASRKIKAINSNGNQLFLTETLQGEAFSGAPLATMDTDYDGHPEIYGCTNDITPPYDARITKFDYNGNKLCNSTVIYKPCWGGITIADVDNDGWFEIFLGDRSCEGGPGGCTNPWPDNPTVGLACYNASNLNLLWKRPNIYHSTPSPVIYDIDGDGDYEVIANNIVNKGTIVINGSTGVDIPGMNYSGAEIGNHAKITVYDIDGDGNAEAFASADRGYLNMNFTIFDLVDGTFDFTPEFDIRCAWPPIAGDVTGDGKMEIIAGISEELGHNYSRLAKGYIIIYNSTFKAVDSIIGYENEGQLWEPSLFDCDSDGLYELIISTRDGGMYCYDTPSSVWYPEPRTTKPWYGELRQGAAKYQPEPGPKVIINQDTYYDFANQTRYTVSDNVTNIVNSLDYYNNTFYVLYMKGLDPDFYIKKFWTSNSTFSNEQFVIDAGTNSFDHMYQDIKIDDNGYIHITLSCHNSHPNGFGMKYLMSTNPENISSWNSVEYDRNGVIDWYDVASYSLLRTVKDKVYIFNKPGSNQSGYSMWYKYRNESDWTYDRLTTTQYGTAYNTYAKRGEISKINNNYVMPWLFFYRNSGTEDENVNVDMTYALYNITTDSWWYANNTKITDGNLNISTLVGDIVQYGSRVGVELYSGMVSLNAKNEPIVLGTDPSPVRQDYDRIFRMFYSDSTGWIKDALELPYQLNKDFAFMGICGDEQVAKYDNGTMAVMVTYVDNNDNFINRGNYTREIVILKSDNDGIDWCFENLTSNNKCDRRPQQLYGNGFMSMLWKQIKLDYDDDGSHADSTPDNLFFYCIGSEYNNYQYTED